MAGTQRAGALVPAILPARPESIRPEFTLAESTLFGPPLFGKART